MGCTKVTAFGGFRSDEQRRKSRMTSAEGFCWVSKTRPQRSPSIPLNSTPAPAPSAQPWNDRHSVWHPCTTLHVLTPYRREWCYRLWCGRKVGVSTTFHSVISAMEEATAPQDKCSGLWWADEWMGQFAWWRHTHTHTHTNAVTHPRHRFCSCANIGTAAAIIYIINISLQRQ